MRGLSYRISRIFTVLLSVCLITSNLYFYSYADTTNFIPIEGTEAILADADTGVIIYEQNSMSPVAPASTTKILTTLLVIEAIERGELSLDTPVTATQSAIGSINSLATHINPRIKVGETLNVLELLLAVIIKSDCQACNILAEKVSGSVSAFAELMNQRSAELGCVNSHWSEPSGYPAPDHFTNAYSLYLITREAYKHDLMQLFQQLI